MKSVAYPSPEATLENAAELASYVPDMDRLIDGLQSGMVVPSHAAGERAHRTPDDD